MTQPLNTALVRSNYEKITNLQETGFYLFSKKGIEVAMQTGTETQGSEKKGPLSDEGQDVHTLITHVVSLVGYEVDSVVEIKFPADEKCKYAREAVNDIVRTLENAFLNIAFTESGKFKKPEERKKLTILMDIRVNYNE